MLRLLQIAFLLAIVPVSGSGARAEFFTGNEIHSFCANNKSLALGYISGIVDATAMAELTDELGIYKICVPQKVTTQQVTDIACKYINDHPGNRHQTANWTILQSLQDAFPCPKAKKP